MELSNIGTIKALMEKYGFHFSKAMGQNFIINPDVCPRIAEMGGAKKGIGVIEIGAGIGVLTVELAKRADKVVCIELDKKLLPILAETLKEYDNIKIVNQDVLKVDIRKLIEEEFAGLDVVVAANLPYYITSPILMGLLEQRLPIKAITVMVQKEAAERLIAEPCTRAVGAVTFAVRYFSNPQKLFSVARGSFMPSPNVDSVVIRLDILEKPTVAVKDEKMYFRVIKGAFSQRRKTILNCLSSSFSIPKEEMKKILSSVNVAENLRAEQITIEQFGTISDWIVSNYD